MKKYVVLVVLIFAVPALILWAQGGHSTHVFWTPPTDATSATTYTVYAAPGTCPASGLPAGATAIATGISAAFYDDSAVTVGATKCYYVEAVTNGATSGPSNTAPATTPANAPTGCGAKAN